MAVSLTHSYTAVGTEAGDGEVGKAEWNAEHALTGTADRLLGFDGTGASAEYTVSGGLSISGSDLAITSVAWSLVTSTPTTLSGYGITDAATSAQGALADSAVQPGDNVSDLTNDAGYQTAAQVDSDISTHNAVTTAHGISAFGATLVDDADAAAARTTLGLGTAATTASSDYATAAQGALAASAVQPGDDADTLGSGTATDGWVLTADGAGGAAWEAVPAGFDGAFSSLTGTPTTVSGYGIVDAATLTGTQTLTNKTLTAPVLDGGYSEEVYALSGTSAALDPANGSIQTHTLSGNTTYTDSLSAGESITLMIDDGTAYTVTWPTMTWVNNAGVAPTLATTGYTVVVLWKVSTTLYGSLVGDGS